MAQDSKKTSTHTNNSPLYETFTKNSKEKEIQISPKDIKPIPNGSEKK